MDFPGSSAGKESTCNAGEPDSISGLGKSPGRGRERLPTPVFWPGEFHGLSSPWGCKESDTTERLSLRLLVTILDSTALNDKLNLPQNQSIMNSRKYLLNFPCYIYALKFLGIYILMPCWA